MLQLLLVGALCVAVIWCVRLVDMVLSMDAPTIPNVNTRTPVNMITYPNAVDEAGNVHNMDSITTTSRAGQKCFFSAAIRRWPRFCARIRLCISLISLAASIIRRPICIIMRRNTRQIYMKRCWYSESHIISPLRKSKNGGFRTCSHLFMLECYIIEAFLFFDIVNVMTNSL